MVGRILILPPRPLVLLYTSAVILANMSLGTAKEETAYRIKILSQLALRGGNYLGGPESLRWRVFSSRTQMSEFKHEEDSWSLRWRGHVAGTQAASGIGVWPSDSQWETGTLFS